MESVSDVLVPKEGEKFWEYLRRAVPRNDGQSWVDALEKIYRQQEDNQDHDTLAIVRHYRQLACKENPAVSQWRHDYGSDRYPLFADFLIGLRFGGAETASPSCQEFDPAAVIFHSEDELEDLLYQKPLQGATVFLYEHWWEDDNNFHQPQDPSQPLLSLALDHLANPTPDGDVGPYYSTNGLAFGFIRGTKLDVYPFPVDWPPIVERVKGELGRMTAREKALKEVPFELRAAVATLGWETVNQMLQQIKPS